MVAERWDADKGHVSRAFNEWENTLDDMRRFLEMASRSSRLAYEAEWVRAGEAAAAGDVDQGDVFEIYNQGPLPGDFDWMLHAAVIKDAVTAYEVYLEKAINEALTALSKKPVTGKDGYTPNWKQLADACDGLLRDHPTIARELAPADGADSLLNTHRIKGIRDLRHVLTHRRGELRTEKDRKELGRRDDDIGDTVRLDKRVVAAILADLDSSVRAVDPLIWSLAWRNTQPRTRAPLWRGPSSSTP